MPHRQTDRQTNNCNTTGNKKWEYKTETKLEKITQIKRIPNNENLKAHVAAMATKTYWQRRINTMQDTKRKMT